VQAAQSNAGKGGMTTIVCICCACGKQFGGWRRKDVSQKYCSMDCWNQKRRVAKRDQLLSLLQGGLNCDQIAERLGVAASTVRGAIRRFGIKRKVVYE